MFGLGVTELLILLAVIGFGLAMMAVMIFAIVVLVRYLNKRNG